MYERLIAKIERKIEDNKAWVKRYPNDPQTPKVMRLTVHWEGRLAHWKSVLIERHGS